MGIRRLLQKYYNFRESESDLADVRKGEELVIPMALILGIAALVYFNLINPRAEYRFFLNIMAFLWPGSAIAFQLLVVPKPFFNRYWSNFETMIYSLLVLAVVTITGGLKSIWIFVIYIIGISIIPSLVADFAIPLAALQSFGLVLVGSFAPGRPLFVKEDLFYNFLVIISPFFFGVYARDAMVHLSERKRRIQEVEITAQKLEEEKLKIERTLAGIDEGILVLDLEGRVSLVTQKAAQLLEEKVEELKGRKLRKRLVLIDDQGRGVLEEIAGTKKMLKFTSAHRVEKAQYFFDLDVTPLKIEEEIRGSVMVFRDVTQQQELERMKLDFVAMGVHELRTPLTLIRGYLSVYIEESKTELTPEQNEFLQRMQISTQELTNLVDNFLAVSKLESGRLELKKEKVDWNEVLKETVEFFRESAKQKRLAIEYNLMEDFPQVGVDLSRMKEVVSNLLNNAIKFTQKGTIMISTYLSKDKDYIVTSIGDTGQGIPQEALPYLFTKFYRVAGPLGEGAKGTGLGLFIAKSLVGMHGGKIWVESELDGGSTFFFSLPLEKIGEGLEEFLASV